MVKLTLQALNSGVSCVSDGARAAGGMASGLAARAGWKQISPAEVRAERLDAMDSDRISWEAKPVTGGARWEVAGGGVTGEGGALLVNS